MENVRGWNFLYGSGIIEESLMKNKFLTALLLLMFILSGGCFPYSYETVSSDIIGMRKDNSGKICEKIIRYDKKLNFIALMGHDGFFRPGYFNYSRYSAFQKICNTRFTLWKLFPSCGILV